MCKVTACNIEINTICLWNKRKLEVRVMWRDSETELDYLDFDYLIDK
jgi:hypothetical protein